MSSSAITPSPSPPPYDEKRDGSSVEKGKEEFVVAESGSHGYHFDTHDLDQVQRKLQQRHVQQMKV